MRSTANGPAAEQLLAKWLCSSFRDFSTTVYQHQESIRVVVKQEPRERNDAQERLLVLSDYRNLLGGIAKANAAGCQKDVGNKCDSFEGRIATAVSMADWQLDQSRRDAEMAGVPRIRLTEKTAVEVADHALELLQGFAKD